MVWCVQYAATLPLRDGCVVAIGNFDGVHAGHREVLKVAMAEGKRLGVPVAALTFEPHPRTVIFPDKKLIRLTELREKVRLLGQAGVQGVAVLGFNTEVAQWSAEDFIQRVLVDWLGTKVVCVGENFRFGHKAAGTVETLRADGRFEVQALALVTDARGKVISSSGLRGENRD